MGTKYKLRKDVGKFGRHEQHDDGKVFIDYQAGQVVDGLSDDELAEHGDRFDEMADGEDIATVEDYTDIVDSVLRAKIVDVRGILGKVEDRDLLEAVVARDRRAGVVGLVGQLLARLPKD